MQGLTRRSILLSAAGFAGFTPDLRAQPTSPDPAAAAAEQAAYEASASLDETIQAYIDRSAFRMQPGTIVEFGTASVPKPGNDPDWAKLRTLAFEEAQLSAQAKIVQAQSSSIQAETVSRLYRAGNAEPPPYQPTELDRPGMLPDLMRRLLGVARGRLDAELRELGIDPAAFERTPEPQRHLQMSNAIRIRSTTRAVGELAGFVPVQTFESHDGNGNFRIGVVVVGSARVKAVIQQILTRRGEFQPDMDRARDIRALVADRRALVDDFGVRLLYDTAGLPAIVSFAQWGISYRGNDRNRMEMERDTAAEQVRSAADRQIAEFLAASGQYEATSAAGREIEAVAMRHADGYDERRPSTVTVTDELLRIMRRRAQVSNLTGLTTLASWTQAHPVTGQRIIGSVRTWSAAAERDIRSYRDQRPPAAEAARPGMPQGQSGIRSGRDLLNSRDF
jgi:hypothetical protein